MLFSQARSCLRCNITKLRCQFAIIATLLSFTLLTTPALAQSAIDVDVTYSTYEIDSDTLPDIQAEMNLEGVPTALSGHTVTRILCSRRRHS